MNESGDERLTAWIVHESATKVEETLVGLVEDRRRNVRYVTACVRLPGDVSLVIFHPKDAHEVLVESDEICCSILFAGGRNVTNGEVDPHRVLDPEHVRKVNK